jgi:hypothetical protein
MFEVVTKEPLEPGVGKVTYADPPEDPMLDPAGMLNAAGFE